MRNPWIIFVVLLLPIASLARNDKIDADVIHARHQAHQSIIIFATHRKHVANLLHDLIRYPHVTAHALQLLPAVVAIVPRDRILLKTLAARTDVAHISRNIMGNKETELSLQSILLTSSKQKQQCRNWWHHGYTGKSGVVGILDSGIAHRHPSLENKTIINDPEIKLSAHNIPNGVRTAHATGVACIYSGEGDEHHQGDRGIAYDAKTIVNAYAGDEESEGDAAQGLLLSLRGLDWMVARAPVKPTVINYSFGNGYTNCKHCPDWSGFARIVDVVVNRYHIPFVKSAGNEGWIEPSRTAPYHGSLTVPADNYNGITVGNMSHTIEKDSHTIETPNRLHHRIRYTSSRGPTKIGRRKPDIVAPGNNTRTCAPDPEKYPHLHYRADHDYHQGYRLMGGTSAAAPHVGGAILLLEDAGINDPMSIKALLINSADAWTDNNNPSRDDPLYHQRKPHTPVRGSHWDRTYGWGYLNMDKAYRQRDNIIKGVVKEKHRWKTFITTLPAGGKVTLVHERRVGYDGLGHSWPLSALYVDLYDAKTGKLLASDHSRIDTVHQVANCHHHGTHCSTHDKKRRVLIRVTLHSKHIAGSNREPFALVASQPITST